MIEKLETERLILRELTEEDAEEMYKNWASDDEVSKYVRWSTHKNIEERNKTKGSPNVLLTGIEAIDDATEGIKP